MKREVIFKQNERAVILGDLQPEHFGIERLGEVDVFDEGDGVDELETHARVSLHRIE
jgi:hypothetical protein